MRRKAAALALLALAACGVDSGSGSTLPAEPNESSTTSDLTPRTTTSRVGQGDGSTVPDWFVDQQALPSELEAMIVSAIAEAAGVEPGAVLLTGSMFVQWPNSSLGCAEPGEMSLQVITDGFLAYFETDGTTYRVHTDLDSGFRICELALPELPPQT